MATDMVIGQIYLIESNTDNQEWIPTVDNIDLATNYVGQNGIEYCTLQIPKNWRKRGNTGILITDSGGGSSFDLRSSRRSYQMLAGGIETSKTNADLIDKFLMSDRHTSGASAVFERYHLIIKYGTTDYVQFMDSGSVMRDYCTGAVTSFEIIWNESKPQTAVVRLNWRSIW